MATETFDKEIIISDIEKIELIKNKLKEPVDYEQFDKE